MKPNRLPSKFAGFGVSVFALVVCAVAAQAQVLPPAPSTLPNPLSLQQAIQIAIQHQPQQSIAATQTTQAQGTILQAKSQYYPTITPTYQYEINSSRQFGTGINPDGSNQAIGNTHGGTGNVAATWTLFDSGKREVANAQARRTLDIAKDNASNINQTVIDAVTEDYYSLLRAMDLVNVAQAQVASAQQELDLVQAQVKAGTVAAANVYQAKANLANAQVTLAEDQGGIDTSSATLKNELGVDSTERVNPVPLPTTLIAAPAVTPAAGSEGEPATATATPTPAVVPAPDQTGSTSDVGTVPATPPAPVETRLPVLPVDSSQKKLDEYLQTAYANRPDIRQQEAMVAFNDLAVKQAEINAGLQVASTYNFIYTPQNDFGPTGSDSQLIVTATYPLFDGGFNRGAIKIAQAQRDAAKDTLEQTRQSIHLAVEQAFINRQEALTSATLALTAVQAAQVNYNSFVAEQRVGLATVVDVTTAEVTLTQSQNQYVTAIYGFYIADSALLRAIGQNDVAVSAP